MCEQFLFFLSWGCCCDKWLWVECITLITVSVWSKIPQVIKGKDMTWMKWQWNDSTAWHDTTRHGMAQYSTVQYTTAQHSTTVTATTKVQQKRCVHFGCMTLFSTSSQAWSLVYLPGNWFISDSDVIILSDGCDNSPSHPWKCSDCSQRACALARVHWRQCMSISWHLSHSMQSPATHSFVVCCCLPDLTDVITTPVKAQGSRSGSSPVTRLRRTTRTWWSLPRIMWHRQLWRQCL